MFPMRDRTRSGKWYWRRRTLDPRLSFLSDLSRAIGWRTSKFVELMEETEARSKDSTTTTSSSESAS